MSHASERDLFARSLAGDWQSRVNLYKRFFHENSRVRRLGGEYSDIDDFLHDSFTNFLRAGHTFQRSSRIAERAEDVAIWTALERERLRVIDSSGARNFVRMCAAIEGAETSRARLATYVPPRSGPEDTLPSRISGIVGEMQFNVIRTRANETAGWEDTAAAAGRSVAAIGPFFVRAVERLSRFFGAPPHLNDDLEPVFSEISRREASVTRADPSKPRGRAISMQLDPSFYAVTPEFRKIGLSVPAEVRTAVLWDAARASEPPGDALRDHLARCRYCSDVLRSLLLMQQAARSGADADFLLCPGASTLLGDSEAAEAFHQHLAECELCRGERTRALGRAEADEPDEPDEPATAATNAKSGRKTAWAAAAAIIFCGLLIAGIRHITAQKQILTAAPEAVAETQNTRYADLAQRIPFDDPKLLASVLPRNQLRVMEAIKVLKGGNRPAGKMMAERVSNESNDPGARMLFAECLYAEGALRQGYREMLKAEGMSPRKSFRCWATLQCALMSGDKAIAEREIGHLSSDPDYAAQAKAILVKLQSRK